MTVINLKTKKNKIELPYVLNESQFKEYLKASEKMEKIRNELKKKYIEINESIEAAKTEWWNEIFKITGLSEKSNNLQIDESLKEREIIVIKKCEIDNVAGLLSSILGSK